MSIDGARKEGSSCTALSISSLLDVNHAVYLSTKKNKAKYFSARHASTTKYTRNVHRETATPLTDGFNNNRISSFLHSTNSLCFSCARRHYYVSGKGSTQAVLEMQLQLCSEWTPE